jgi:hypothetical protein
VTVVRAQRMAGAGREDSTLSVRIIFMTYPSIGRLATHLALGSLLEELIATYSGYELVAHWKQGEFHHDVVVRVCARGDLPGDVLLIATNCNGGVKEVLCFSHIPDRYSLWHARCPQNPEFAGKLAPVLGAARTVHWFDPCALLSDDARSELKPECRKRQRGGGYQPLA